jgi:hypothetical protein
LDPPEARALVLAKDGLRVALVSMDLVVIRPALRKELGDAVPDLDLDALILVATHTHSGPGGYMPGRLPARIVAGSYQPGISRGLVLAAQQALRRAVEDLAPAHVVAGSAELGLARNRRDSDGPHETSLPFVRIDFPGEQRPILLFAYGAHPVVLSPKSQAYSADYVGATRAWLASHGWRSLFLPGPLGDQEPKSELGPLWPRDVGKQRAQVVEIGAVLAEAVQRRALELPAPDFATNSDVRLAAVHNWIDLPEARIRRFCTIWWFSPFVKGTLHGFLSRRAPIHAVRIADAQIIALPGEPVHAVGREIREQLDSRGPVFVVAHANDWIGYVVSEQGYRRGGYEACLSFHGADLAKQLVDAAVAVGEQLGSSGP